MEIRLIHYLVYTKKACSNIKMEYLDTFIIIAYFQTPKCNLLNLPAEMLKKIFVFNWNIFYLYCIPMIKDYY
jgi:hypothetical protein